MCRTSNLTPVPARPTSNTSVNRERLGPLQDGSDLPAWGASAFSVMLSEEAILKIRVAIYQLRVYGSGRRDGMLAAQAITMLEQVIESIEKQQLEYTTPHAA